MKTSIFITGITLYSVCAFSQLTYPIVDTGQKRTFNDSEEIHYPKFNYSYYGQDAQYKGNQARYQNNGDGTITDLVTGLMWQQNPGSKKYYSDAVSDAKKCRTGGYKDWRMPTIKELYSLIDFSGVDVDIRSSSTTGQKPFINTRYFKFSYGKPSDNDRLIDSQFTSSTKYVSKTMDGQDTMFGVNFADGRIKGYPTNRHKKFYTLYVRGNPNYGKNKFVNNNDGTITDKATGLMWTRLDSGKGLTWKQALEFAEKMKYAGYSDWRLPTAKELQSIVDYTRSPDTTGSAAIDPIFKCNPIKNEGGKKDYAFYWTSTSHKRSVGAENAAYIAFGRALGWMRSRRTGKTSLMDVHGAGAQRSDPKSGDPKKYPKGRGPQGDVIRIYNYVRLVRGGNVARNTSGPSLLYTKSAENNISRGRYSPNKGSESSFTQTAPLENPGSSSAGNLSHSQRFMRRLDKDGDGKVSKSEFDGPGNHFSRLDKNNDGYISSDEAPSFPPPGGRGMRRGQSGNR